MRILALVGDAFGGMGGIAQANRDLFEALAQICEVEKIVILPRLSAERIAQNDDDVKGKGLYCGVIPECPPKFIGESVRTNPPRFLADFSRESKASGSPLKTCGDDKDGSKIYQFRAQPCKLFYTFKAFWIAFRQGPFHLVFCGHLYMAPLAALLSRVFCVPFWIHLHGVEAWKRPSNLLRWAAENADYVTAISRFTRRRFLEWANIAPDKVKILPDTVSDRFKPGPKNKELTHRYQLQDKKILLTVGRLSSREKYKGHDRVIEAISSVIPASFRRESSGSPTKAFGDDKGGNLVYVIAGDGDDRPRLEQLAKDLGVSDAVRFTGRLSEEDLVKMYQTSDLFVMPSTGEGFGIAFLEAMACGVPAVGMDQDGSLDPLQDGELGYVVSESLDSRHPEALGRRISEILHGVYPEMLRSAQHDDRRRQDNVVKVKNVFGKACFQNYVAVLFENFMLKRTFTPSVKI